MSKANAVAVNPSTSELAAPAKPQLHVDSFCIFGLRPRFQLDKAHLTERYHQLMQAVHPDRYSNASEADRRYAMQWASRVNEAYRELLNPLKRARLLCEMADSPVDVLDTSLPPAFLVQQMQWREDFESISQSSDKIPIGQREQQLNQIEATIKQAAKQLAEAFSQSALGQGRTPCTDDLKSAAALIRQWMFLEKFIDDIEQQRMQWLEVQPS